MREEQGRVNEEAERGERESGVCDPSSACLQETSQHLNCFLGVRLRLRWAEGSSASCRFQATQAQPQRREPGNVWKQRWPCRGPMAQQSRDGARVCGVGWGWGGGGGMFL